MSGTPMIRLARLDEAPLLTEIAFWSKAYWGYSDDFMRAARADLTITSAQLAAQAIYVLEAQEEVQGFYQLREITTEQVELTDLFLHPQAIGRGWGRALWEHAVETARGRGYMQMIWDSDPNAEGFYLRMGAQRTGTVASSVKPGRLLPRMCYLLTGESDGTSK